MFNPPMKPIPFHRNSLTLAETQYVIQKGLAIGRKTLNEQVEAINHQEAIHYIRDFAERGQ